MCAAKSVRGARVPALSARMTTCCLVPPHNISERFPRDCYHPRAVVWCASLGVPFAVRTIQRVLSSRRFFGDVRRTEIMVGVSSLACACVVVCVCAWRWRWRRTGRLRASSVHALHNNQISNLPPPGLVTTRNSTHTTQHAQQNVPITLKNCALAHRQARHALWSLYAHRSLSLSQPHPHRSLSSPHNVHLTAISTATCSPRSSPAQPHSPA